MLYIDFYAKFMKHGKCTFGFLKDHPDMPISQQIRVTYLPQKIFQAIIFNRLFLCHKYVTHFFLALALSLDIRGGSCDPIASSGFLLPQSKQALDSFLRLAYLPRQILPVAFPLRPAILLGFVITRSGTPDPHGCRLVEPKLVRAGA